MVALAGPPPAGFQVPRRVIELAGGETIEPVWLNLEGGVTVRLGADRYLKWSHSPLTGEIERLQWAVQFHPVPRVLDHGSDWMLTEAIGARSAVETDGPTAARAVGEGLRALHEDLPVEGCPFEWSAESRGGIGAPVIDELVVCHGDACVPNTLVDAQGDWIAHVDLGRLGLADRWADLAVASANLDANFGPGLQPTFFAAYGIDRDEDRIQYYRTLWDGSELKMGT